VNKIAPLSTAMLLVAAAAAAQAGDLAVTVEHVQTDDGQVLVRPRRFRSRPCAARP